MNTSILMAEIQYQRLHLSHSLSFHCHKVAPLSQEIQDLIYKPGQSLFSIMSLFLFRRFQIIVSNGGFPLITSSIHLGFPPNHFPSSFRLLSTYGRYRQKERPFVVSYLVNSCGLSPESAKSASQKVDFQTPDRPDSVLCLLKDYGFNTSHISNLVKKDARFLLANPAKTLSPKLEFLCSIGVSSSDLPKIICSNPQLLLRSLNNSLVPLYNTLRSVLASDEQVFHCLSRCFRSPSHMVKNAPTNIALLRKIKIPDQKISWLLIYAPGVVGEDPKKFSGSVNRVIELGIDLSEKSFVCALQIVSQRSRKTWEQKMEVYRSWGLSEEQMLSAFKRSPNCMSVSAKKIRSTMDFIVNKMGYKAEAVVCFPPIFRYNLEKRIIPRFSVIRVLKMKGLVKEDISIASVMVKTEKYFLNSYVIEYQGKAPELLSIYQGKTTTNWN